MPGGSASHGPTHMTSRPLLVLATLLPAALLTRAAHAAPVTVHYPFEDARYLQDDQDNGAAAYLPDAALASGKKLPVVVFLHGINPAGEMHVWMHGAHDLRPLVERLVASGVPPFVLAAPSQTREASRGRFLWPDFDVDDFVSETAQAISDHVELDTTRVYVVGHSGAGCNEHGGLADAARVRRTRVRGVMAIDTCMDDDAGAAMAQIQPDVKLWVTWQPYTWWRDLHEFRHALGKAEPRVRIQRLNVTGPHPHEAIVPRSFAMMARAWLARRHPHPP